MKEENRKPIQEWSRDEMEAWFKETPQAVVISEKGKVENKMQDTHNQRKI